jgi:hypothetical protein
MQKTRFERLALARFFVAGWVACFGVAIEHANAQYVNPPPPPPPPTFNPATPYTVPQSPETPVSPGLPSAAPGSAVVSPSVESLPSTGARSHRRRVISTTRTASVAQAYSTRHSGRRYHRHRSRGSHTGAGHVIGPSYYPFLSLGYSPPFGYDRGPYCGWQRQWDGYWVPPTCY